MHEKFHHSPYRVNKENCRNTHCYPSIHPSSVHWSRHLSVQTESTQSTCLPTLVLWVEGRFKNMPNIGITLINSHLRGHSSINRYNLTVKSNCKVLWNAEHLYWPCDLPKNDKFPTVQDKQCRFANFDYLGNIRKILVRLSNLVYRLFFFKETKMETINKSPCNSQTWHIKIKKTRLVSVGFIWHQLSTDYTALKRCLWKRTEEKLLKLCCMMNVDCWYLLFKFMRCKRCLALWS